MEPIELYKKYSPRKVARSGWIQITGENKDSAYNNVLSLMHSGKLPKHALNEQGNRYFLWGHEVVSFIKNEGGMLPEIK